MAAKIKIMKMLQEIRGLADVTERRPGPRQPGLFLIQLRAHALENRQDRGRLVIEVEMLDRFDVPQPVKIKHIQPVPPSASFETEIRRLFLDSQI